MKPVLSFPRVAVGVYYMTISTNDEMTMEPEHRKTKVTNMRMCKND